MASLDGNVAIVTGAARGIGREIALTLARAGAAVAVVDIDAEGGEATARAAGPAGLFLAADIADPAQVRAVVATVAERLGTVDILVNNAAVNRPTGFFDLGADELDWILGVNVRGSFLMMQAAADVMRRAGGGRIVNIASIAGKGYRNTSNIAYAGSKGALIAMTRVAAAALGPHGITVNAICPGLTETEMLTGWLTRRAAEAGITLEEARRERVGELALGRMNSVGDIAESVLFMVSPAARNITGQSLNVDGGLIWD